MLISTSRLRSYRAALFIALASGLGVSPVSAQTQIGSREDTELPFTLKFKERFEALRDAKAAPDLAKDKDLFEIAGKYLIGRTTWPAYSNSDAGMRAIHKEFNDLMNNPATVNGKNQDFMRLLTAQLLVNFNNILLEEPGPGKGHARDYRNQQATVTNVALMLPVLGKCKQPAIQDFLLKVLAFDKDGKPVVHPFIRMCAAKALGELNNAGGPQLVNKQNFQEVQADRAREIARIDALAKFMDAPYPPEGKGPEYDNALVYVRREGVKALAQLRTPGYEFQKGKISGPVAYHLLRVANGGPAPGGAPPYALSERLEAAIGICQLQTSAMKSFNGELAVFVVANVLVDLADAYINDYPVFKAQPKGKDGPQPLLPWKYYAAAMEEVLVVMAATLKDTPAAKKLDDNVRINVKTTLEGIKQQRKIDPPQVLQNYVANNRPAVLEVFLGNKDFVLK